MRRTFDEMCRGNKGAASTPAKVCSNMKLCDARFLGSAHSTVRATKVISAEVAYTEWNAIGVVQGITAPLFQHGCPPTGDVSQVSLPAGTVRAPFMYRFRTVLLNL